MGDFASRAASRAATTVEEEVTLMAGMAARRLWSVMVLSGTTCQDAYHIPRTERA
jgi:hypothetical protein